MSMISLLRSASSHSSTLRSLRYTSLLRLGNSRHCLSTRDSFVIASLQSSIPAASSSAAASSVLLLPANTTARHQFSSMAGTNDNAQASSEMKDLKRKAENQGDETRSSEPAVNAVLANTAAGANQQSDADAGANTAAGANQQSGAAAGGNKRPAAAGGKRKQKQSGRGWPKQETKFSHRKMNNQEDQVPHAGSYATAAMRERFGVEVVGLPTLEEEDKNNNTDDNNEIDDETKNAANKKAKKRVAFLIGYLGTNYAGFQINEAQRTLQAELELALVRCNFLSMQNFGYPQKYGWSTSGRTDKGVHACAQVCSAKIELAPDQTVDQVREALNAKLPSDIRVLDVVKVTRTFCAKTSRDRVRYQYMIPSFALSDPTELKELFEKMGCRNNGRSPSDPLSPQEIAEIFPHLKKFRATPKHLEKLSDALKVYEGTHSFHNYARGVGAEEARAARYIVSFHVEDPIVFEDGMEWIPTQVMGQSFLLNQIRKMVSMAMDVARGAAPLELVGMALLRENDVRVNIAPSQGLYLEMSYYGGYNLKKQTNPGLKDLEWASEEAPAHQRWKDFRNGTLMKHVVEEEEREGNFIKYLYIHEYIFNYRKMYEQHIADIAVIDRE